VGINKVAGLAKSQRSLKSWTAQKWTTKSGKRSSDTGERYLPEKAIKALSPAEYAATTKAKRAGKAAGKQFVAQPKSIKAEAFERCGLESRTGYDLKTARRSMNLMAIEWANRGINLWTVEQQSIPMVTGQPIYPLPVDTIDILDAVIRTQNGSTSNQIDINISRIAEPTYMSIPNKLATGRPIQMYVNRQTGMDNAISATLVGNISATDTTITLSSTANVASVGFIKIGAETISYSNVIGNQLVNCYRGQNGTTAAAHVTGAAITVQNLPCVNLWPTPNPPGNQYTFVYYRLRDVASRLRETMGFSFF
jgi:hypothetical protein